MSNTNTTKAKVDMLNGPLFMKILIFALPLAASSLLQQLFNSVDVAVVGRFASSKALAAVGSNAPVISLLINLFIGISMGANVVISNHLGQRDEQSIRHAISTVTLVAAISGLLLVCIGIGVARPILELMDTPSDVLDMAVLYLRIYFIGIPFFLIFNFGAAILRSVGDTRRPLYILVVAGIINTVLNLIFVIGLGMSVEGVAIATAVANAISAAWIIQLLRKEPGALQLQFKHLRIYKKELKRMLQIGVPAGLQGMVFSISNVVVQSAINGYGAAAIAGSAAAVNFEYYCYYIIVACNGAAISFIGQNYGAQKYDRVRRIYRICLLMGLIGCFIANALFTWQNQFFLSFFTTDAEVIHYGAIRMEGVLLFQFIACSYEVTGSALRGMGESMLPTIMTVFGTCILRIIWVFAVLPHYTGFAHLLQVYPLSWILTGAMVIIAYKLKMRQICPK